jgi:hypothetical protein
MAEMMCSFISRAVEKAGYTSLVEGAKISYDVVTNRDKQRAENLRLGWAVHKAEEPNVQHELAQPNIAPTTDPVPQLTLEPDHASVRQSGAPDQFRKVYDCIAPLRSIPSLVSDRAPVSRAALPTAIAEAVRKTEPCCEPFIGVIVEHAVSNSASDANWAIRGVRFGRADRSRASEALCKIVELMQRELILSDDQDTPDDNDMPTKKDRSGWVLPVGFRSKRDNADGNSDFARKTNPCLGFTRRHAYFPPLDCGRNIGPY